MATDRRDPHGDYDQLADAVNEVYRNMPDNPLSGKVVHTDHVHVSMSRANVVSDTLQEIIDGVIDSTIDDTGINVLLSVPEACELLQAAVRHVAMHEETECRVGEFARCGYSRAVIYYAARIYTQILEESHR